MSVISWVAQGGLQDAMDTSSERLLKFPFRAWIPYSDMMFLRETKEGLLLTVRVTPRSARDEIVGTHGDALRIRLNAPPVDGKANDRLRRFLSKRLEVPPSPIQI